MAKIPLPSTVTRSISQKAAQYAREDVQGRGWKSSGALQAYSAEGQIGIRTTVKYLMYQERGISPFVMWWVNSHQGAIPLGCKQGDGPHFRRGGTAGTPGLVDIPHQGKKWRDQRWRHPGLKGQRFMQKAIVRAVKESRPQIQASLMQVLGGGKG